MKDILIEKIVKKVKRNSTLIIAQIAQEDIDVYNFIQDQFQKSSCNIKENSLFKFTYRKYYFRNNERFFKPEFFEAYFNNLSNKILQKKLNSEIKINFTLEIINTQSQKLFIKNFKNINQLVEEINVSNYPPGIYYLKIYYGDKSFVRKFAIQ